jgi:hypothetical protein
LCVTKKGFEVKSESAKLIAVLVAAGCLFVASVASAGLTAAGTMGAKGDPGGGFIGPPLTDIKIIQTDATTYVNTYSISGVFPENAGDKIRTIVSSVITTVTDGVTYDPTRGPGSLSNQMVLVTALEGVGVSNVYPNGTVLFTAGKAMLFSNLGANWNRLNPSTWGIGDVDGVAGITAADIGMQTLAEWTLAPQEAVAAGPTGALITPFAASEVNTASIDSVSGPTLTQGRFLFNEASPFAPGASRMLEDGTTVSGANVPGDSFLNLDPLAGFVAEQLYITSRLVVESGSEFQSSLTVAQKAILNAIGMYGMGAAVDGGATAGFATFGTSTVTDWLTTNPAVSRDFRSFGDISAHPMGVIPEPMSLLVWAGMGLFGGAAAVRRKFRQKS